MQGAQPGALWQPRRVGWSSGMGGKVKREGTYVYLWLIHVGVWQKAIQQYKAITLQLKINFKNYICKKEFPICLRLNNIPLYVQPHCVNPFLHGWTSGLPQLSAIVNNAAKEHRCTNMSLDPIVNYLGYTPNMAWLDHVENVFFIFEEAPYCIHSCCPILHSYSQCRMFSSNIWARTKQSREVYDLF